MTRLTPEDEKRIRKGLVVAIKYSGSFVHEHAANTTLLLAEIDALRAELKPYSGWTPGQFLAYQEYHRQAAQSWMVREKELLEAWNAAQAEIATFRNASPSLCNCSECVELRTI